MPSKNTSLSSKVKTSTTKQLFYKPQPYHPLLFQNPGYAKGDTLLHIAVRKFKKIDEIDALIKATGDDTIKAMSHITNDEGKLPIQLIHDIQLTRHNQRLKHTRAYVRRSEQIKNLHEKLFTLVINDPIKKLNDVLDKSEIEMPIDHPHNQRLLNNLKLGCYLVNAVRRYIHESDTHPQYNNYDNKKKNSITQQIIEMRDKADPNQAAAPITFLDKNEQKKTVLSTASWIMYSQEMINRYLDVLEGKDGNLLNYETINTTDKAGKTKDTTSENTKNEETIDEVKNTTESFNNSGLSFFDHQTSNKKPFKELEYGKEYVFENNKILLKAVFNYEGQQGFKIQIYNETKQIGYATCEYDIFKAEIMLHAIVVSSKQQGL